ncbi:hypothetical protein KKC91_00050 [bacterium]|nr:hypothetical protein [bacterium]
MSKIMKCLVVVGFVMTAFLIPLRQDANAGVSEWMKNHPQKGWTYTKDRSYLYFWVYNTHYNWSSAYYYRKDFKPAYTVDEKSYYLYWNLPARWGPAYSTNLAEATFVADYFPKQKYYDLWWGDQHTKEYHNIYMTTYWKLVDRWALGVYLQSYSDRRIYDQDYLRECWYGNYRTSLVNGITYYEIIDNEDDFNSPVRSHTNRGTMSAYDYDTQYYKVGLGLKWYGKAYVGYTYNPQNYTKYGAYPDRPDAEK